MDFMDYKEYHEAKMANNTGSSAFEIEAVLSSVSQGVFFRLLLNFYIHSSKSCFSFILDFLLMVVPVTLEVTFMSGNVFLVPVHMFLIALGIIARNVNSSSILQTLSLKIKNQESYITNYRASTNLVSALCILAVDFYIFPRKFAKTESFGFGLMDLGVGYFISSNGIVTKNLLTKLEFYKTLKSFIVLILLGFIRLLSIKGSNYHEHASEYGVHWNFFFTLGFCKIFSYFVFTISPIKKPYLLALFTGFLHQTLLQFGLQQWVIKGVERDSLLSANKEGLTSLLGYISLYFASVAIGQLINQQNNQVTYKKLLSNLSQLCLGAWVCTGICHLTIGVSRRLANIGYNTWIIASTLTVLVEFVLLDIFISSFTYTTKEILPKISQSPTLLVSINANGLFFFLFANLMTGLINLTFQTLLLDAASSFAIIIIYMFIICVVPFILNKKKWTVKL